MVEGDMINRIDAGFVRPKANNRLWVIGCMGHRADGFVLTPEGYDALVGQLALPW
jgi:hypothetical protein